MLRRNSADPFDDIEDIELPEGVDELIFGDNNNHSLIEQIEPINQPISTQPSVLPLLPVMNPEPTPQASNLHQAVLSGDNRLVAEFIFRQPAQINQQDMLGCTPVHLAVRAQNISIILMLLNAGADLSIPNANNRPPISLRSKTNNECALRLWGIRNQITHPDYRRSMLNTCFEALSQRFLKELSSHSNDMLELFRSVTVNEAQNHLKKNFGLRMRTPLMLICNQSDEHFELAKNIIDLSSTDALTCTNIKGETALSFAQIKKHQNIINYLNLRINPQQTQSVVTPEPEPAPDQSSLESVDSFLLLKEQQKEFRKQLDKNQATFIDCLQWMEKLRKLAEELIILEDNIRKNLQKVDKQIENHEKNADTTSTLSCDEETDTPRNLNITPQYSNLTGRKRSIGFVDNDDEPETESSNNRISTF